MSRTVITPEKVKEINELYLKIKTYAGVARELGIAPSTVKKYIIPDYTSLDDVEIIKFDRTKIPTDKIDFTQFKNKKLWNDLCELNEIEQERIKELWKEMIV